MIYIWNRAHRVRKDLMPKRIIDCFLEWRESQEEKLALIPDPKQVCLPDDVAKKITSQRHRIEYNIINQRKKLNEAIERFKNENK